ncbi:MAG: hypothetical protein PHI81_07825, partial [Synergistaceae bacterium]|nr:hypothetical protein [Synergistaceae bacterium]
MKNIAAVLILIGLFFALSIPGDAADVKELVREANTLFRSADKDFMSGKLDNAWETVQKAKEKIGEAKTADPKNSQALSLEKRIDQLAGKIEKRRAGSSGSGSPSSKPSQPASGEKPKRLPATAGRYLMETDRALKKAEMLLGPDREKQDPARLPLRVREAVAPAEENMGKLLS